MKKKLCILLAFAAIFCLTACLYDPEALEEKHKKEHKEKCEKVMKEMESRLSKKYSDILGNDKDDIVFDVYDLSKGSNQTWFLSGYHPAKAVYKDNGEEFTVQLEVEAAATRFGEMEDSFYGVLYGENVKNELYDFLDSYGVEDINIYYEPCKDILTDDEDLREHLTVFGTYKLESYDKLDELCELADKLNDFGCNNRVSADGYDLCKKKKDLKNMNSNEIREFFEE